MDIVGRLRLRKAQSADVPDQDCHEAADEIERIRKERDEARAAMAWRPIKTAPKNGSPVLLTRAGRSTQVGTWGVCRPQDDGYRANGGVPTWRSYCEMKMVPAPTHWTPLPTWKKTK